MKKNLIPLSNLVLLFIGLFSMILSSCKDDFENNTYSAYEDLPMAAYLKNQPEKYDLWVKILEKADLYNTLNINTMYTLFAPINAGVERYLKKVNLTSVDQMTKDDANYLVRYHLVPNVSIDLGQFQSGAITDLNATDDNLFVEFKDGGLDQIYLNGLSRFNAFDIKVTNGIIHSVDDVLEPLTATLLDRLKDQKYSIFHDLTVATGYDERLNTVYTAGTDPDGNPIQQRFKYTAFAVSDAVYLKEGIHTLAELLNKLGASGSDLKSTSNPANRYMAYHLLAQQRSFADLGKFPAGATKMNFETMAQYELIKISEGGEGLVINTDERVGSAIHFNEINIPCKNGVLHDINHWMPIFVPEQVKIIWEFTDYPDIAANVTQYRNPSLGAQYNKIFVANELTSITWRAQPETKSNVLIYRNNRSADGVWYTGPLNYDHLRVELGESGWIQMRSPTIVKGKYKVKLTWPSTKYASNTGICAFVLDNEMLYPRLVMSNTSSDKMMTQDLGTVEFRETTDHTLRILSLDGKLLTLDYIQFDPIN